MIAAIIFLIRGLHIPARPRSSFVQKLLQFDWLSIFILIPAMVSFLLVLQWGGIKHKWSSAPIIVLLVVGSLLFPTFFVVQMLKGESAMLPLRILKKRSIWVGAVYGFALVAAGQTIIYYVSPSVSFAKPY